MQTSTDEAGQGELVAFVERAEQGLDGGARPGLEDDRHRRRDWKKRKTIIFLA